MVVSLIDSTKEIDEANSLVVLFARMNHAVIGLERFQNAQHTFHEFDFLPTEHVGLDCQALALAAFSPAPCAGTVRIRHIELVDDLKAARGITVGLLSYGYRRQVCCISQVNALVDAVLANQSSPPQFCVNGWSQINSQGHNCITWAETMLAAAGISLEASLVSRSSDRLCSSKDTVKVADPNTHVRDVTCYSRS